MSNRVSGLDEVLAKHYNIIIPEAEAQFFNLARSTVDVSVWLVGLATGVIAFLVGSDDAGEMLGQYSYQASLVLFAFVIFFGVAQRVLFHIGELRKWPISLRLRGSLIGLTENTPLASKLQDHWSVNDIVDRLREDFGVNYSYLIEYNVPLERAREAYNGQLQIHREFEKEGIDNLAEILCAHYGLPESEKGNYFGKDMKQDLEETRAKAMKVNEIFGASNTAYFLAAGFFICGIVALIIGAI